MNILTETKTITAALTQTVLAVAVVNPGEWCAYIDSVPGEDHKCEYVDVVTHGTKLDERVARAIFGDIEGEYRE